MEIIRWLLLSVLLSTFSTFLLAQGAPAPSPAMAAPPTLTYPSDGQGGLLGLKADSCVVVQDISTGTAVAGATSTGDLGNKQLCNQCQAGVWACWKYEGSQYGDGCATIAVGQCQLATSYTSSDKRGGVVHRACMPETSTTLPAPAGSTEYGCSRWQTVPPADSIRILVSEGHLPPSELDPAPKPQAAAPLKPAPNPVAEKKEDKPSGFSSFMSRWGTTIVGVTAGLLASGKVGGDPRAAKQILEVMQQQQQQAGGAGGSENTEIASGDCAAVEQQVADEINALPKTGSSCSVMSAQRNYYLNRGAPSLESACQGNARGERAARTLRNSASELERTMSQMGCR